MVSYGPFVRIFFFLFHMILMHLLQLYFKIFLEILAFLLNHFKLRIQLASVWTFIPTFHDSSSIILFFIGVILPCRQFFKYRMHSLLFIHGASSFTLSCLAIDHHIVFFVILIRGGTFADTLWNWDHSMHVHHARWETVGHLNLIEAWLRLWDFIFYRFFTNAGVWRKNHSSDPIRNFIDCIRRFISLVIFLVNLSRHHHLQWLWRHYLTKLRKSIDNWLVILPKCMSMFWTDGLRSLNHWLYRLLEIHEPCSSSILSLFELMILDLFYLSREKIPRLGCWT